MAGNVAYGPMILILWIPLILNAQQPTATPRDLEDLLYKSESALLPETLFYISGEPNAQPLDLNLTSPEELEASGLFTPYQLQNLINYRDKYGEIYSIYELSALPGFQMSKVLEIKSHISINDRNSQRREKPLQHMVLIELGKTHPESTNNYAGSPLKATIRIRTHPFQKLSMALTYEKDAGEQFFFQKKPQFLSGYLSYKGERFIKHLVVGNFQMNQGVGLVNGAGFFHRVGKLRVNRQSLSQIRPYASKTESMFEQGIACRVGQKKIELLIWASYCTLSLSPSAFTENGEAGKWLEYQRTTGLYRTPGEVEGRGLAYRVHTGMQALYRSQHMAVGVMSGSEWIYPSKKAKEYMTQNDGPALHQKFSLHGYWQKNKFQTFGELAISDIRQMAVLLGTKYYFNDFVQGSFLIHHYGNEYRGSYPSTYGSGSSPENEQGVAFHLHVETGKIISAELTGELFRYPLPRYLSTVPSCGYRVDLLLLGPGKKIVQWKFRVVSKTWQNTPANSTDKLRPLQDSRVSRLDAQLIYNHQDLFRWQTRLVTSYFNLQHNPSPAFAAVQQITVGSNSKLKATIQFVLFQVTEWENRIYLYEPGLYYSFSFPAYYGSGQKTTLLLTLKPVRRLTFSAKISGITKNGNRKWESAIQLRLNL